MLMPGQVRSTVAVSLMGLLGSVAVGVLAVSCAPEDPSPDHPFEFLAKTDEVNQALTTVWTHQFRSPHGAKSKGDAVRELLAAKDVLLRNREEAHEALFAALKDLSAFDESKHLSLVPLLEIIGDDPRILTQLSGLVMNPLDDTDLVHGFPPQEIVRHTALSVLMHHARGGNEDAAKLVLNAVASPHQGVAMWAIRYTYEIEPDRRLAQREMRRRMEPSRHYLIYRD